MDDQRDSLYKALKPQRTQGCRFVFAAASSFEELMKRETSFLLTLGLWAVISSHATAQDSQNRPSPVEPSNILGPQLIAWSEVQKPQPIPQPVPTPKQTKDSERKAEQPANPSVQQPPKTDSTADQNPPPIQSK
jgi:hypothetical protein